MQPQQLQQPVPVPATAGPGISLQRDGVQPQQLQPAPIPHTAGPGAGGTGQHDEGGVTVTAGAAVETTRGFGTDAAAAAMQAVPGLSHGVVPSASRCIGGQQMAEGAAEASRPSPHSTTALEGQQQTAAVNGAAAASRPTPPSATALES